MTDKRMLAIIAVLMAMVVASSGCLELKDINPWAEDEKPKKNLDLTLVLGGQTVARGDNITFAVLVKNNMEKDYNATLTFGTFPKGFSGELFIPTMLVKSGRENGTMARLYIGEAADLGGFKVKVNAKYLERTSVKAKKNLKVEVVAPGQGDARPQDIVEVDYIGFLDDGEIFDTSIADIGRNNNLPKSSEWQGHGDTYKPMLVTLDTHSVVDGFNDGIKGLEIGQSRTVLVPPEEGYAVFINVTIPKTEKVPMVLQMTWNEFVNTYGETPAENMVVKDKYWNWSVQVIDLEGTNVTAMVNPQGLMNRTVNPYGWDSKIVSIDSLANGGKGEIVVEHKYSPGVNVTYRGKNGHVVEETDTGIKIRYNDSTSPLSTKNMWFHIILVKIQIR
jgi:FKBP-type peptidyl-prolyl cis-trans isomerase 2